MSNNDPKREGKLVPTGNPLMSNNDPKREGKLVPTGNPLMHKKHKKDKIIARRIRLH